jgi:hypothetical protein
MHVHFDIVPPRRRVEHPRRLRNYGPHLRILLCLPGGKRKHLVCIGWMVQPDDVAPALAKSRHRLAEVCNDPEQLSKLLAQIEERLSREVEATGQAQAKRRALVG